MSTYNLTRVTEFAQMLISQYVNEGDTVIDCTMGNGNDTVFLAKKVGKNGKVISFDIQNIALENTRKRIMQEEVEASVVLINESHENIEQFVSEEISVAMFNLGYLPGGSNEITTKSTSSLVSIEKCLKLLKHHGAISIIIYYGHEEGVEEKRSILEYVKALDSRQFHVVNTEYINQVNNPPIIITIIKKRF